MAFCISGAKQYRQQRAAFLTGLCICRQHCAVNRINVGKIIRCLRLPQFAVRQAGCCQINSAPVRHRRKGYGMKLSRYEQEVVINLNADEDEATVYTANPVWIRKMDKLCKEFPEVIRLKSWTEVSKTYVLPKNLVRIGKPRTLSEAQLRHLQELQNKV